jgi:hypothetical protein
MPAFRNRCGRRLSCCCSSLIVLMAAQHSNVPNKGVHIDVRAATSIQFFSSTACNDSCGGDCTGLVGARPQC